MKSYTSLGIQRRFTLVILACVLLPCLAFSGWIVYSWKNNMISQRKEDLLWQVNEVQAEVDKYTELCTWSGQAFLGNTRLMQHLDDLAQGSTFSTKELYELYRNDVAGMQHMIAANPYLYQVRIYSIQPHIDEMFPVLYGSERLAQIGWQADFPHRSQWYLDYTDNMFSANIAHCIALIEPIYNDASDVVAVIEVSLDMQQVFPDLFRQGSRFCGLIGADGSVYGNSPFADQLDVSWAVAEQPQVQQVTVGEDKMLVAAIRLQELDAVFYQLYSLNDLYHTVAVTRLALFLFLPVAMVVICLVVNVSVKQMLAQLYRVLEGVRRFSQGELDVEIPVESKDEIGQFSGQINQLLSSIRDLIDRHIQSEMLIKNTEIRALQNQINAHFIYNVLEAIKMMAEIDEKYEIADAVTSLAKLLRYSMKWNRRTVALFEELGYIDNYLALVNLRYDGEVLLHKEVPPTLLMQELPKMSLQPIIENAVLHGGDSTQDRDIWLSVHQIGQTVEISIRNKGECIAPERLAQLRRNLQGQESSYTGSGNGIGLKNVQERIQKSYGEEYGVTITSTAQEGTIVKVVLPCSTLQQEEMK